MIDRYTLPEMGRIWSDAHKYELWCRVEILVLEAHARHHSSYLWASLQTRPISGSVYLSIMP